MQRLAAYIRLLPLVALAAIAVGCASSPDLPSGAAAAATNGVARLLAALESASAPEPGAAAAPAAEEQPRAEAPSEPAAEPPRETAPSAPAAPAAAAAPDIAWRYGGFDGSKAKEDPAVRIGSFRFSRSGMSYRFESGDLSAWGLARTDAGALACAFHWDGARWVGGKFDWISTSRLTRSWENVEDRYRGWDPDAFFAAKRHAFCIVSRDGRRRTNLVED